MGNSQLNECEAPLTKLVSASLKLERRPVKESGRRGGVWEFLSREGLNRWEREEERRRRMEGGERKGRWGHRGGLTGCEYGLTSWVCLQVFSTGLAKTKIKPRNVNLFSIVSAEKRDKERIHTYQVRAEQN